MSSIPLTAILSTVALFVSACDGPVTGSSDEGDGRPRLFLDQSTPRDDRQAVVDRTQEAPVDYSQVPPDSGQAQSAGQAAGSLVTACTTSCRRYAALNCNEDIVDCGAQCPDMVADIPLSCANQFIAYISCASATCDSDNVCESQRVSFAICVGSMDDWSSSDSASNPADTSS